MSSNRLTPIVSASFASEYKRLAARVHELAQPLSDDEFWSKPFPFGNSFGHLVLHLTGNLNYYIGTRVAATGYTRDRDREFAETARLPKADVLTRLDAAVDMVVATAEAQTGDDWTTPYSAEREPDARCRFDIFLKCATHFYHHVGQMIFLAKAHQQRT